MELAQLQDEEVGDGTTSVVGYPCQHIYYLCQNIDCFSDSQSVEYIIQMTTKNQDNLFLLLF